MKNSSNKKGFLTFFICCIILLFIGLISCEKYDYPNPNVKYFNFKIINLEKNIDYDLIINGENEILNTSYSQIFRIEIGDTIIFNIISRTKINLQINNFSHDMKSGDMFGGNLYNLKK